MSSITTPAPAAGQSALVTTNYFDSMGRVWRVGLPDGTSVTNEFNGTGDLKKTFGSRTYPVEYQYDAHGRATNMITWTAYPGTGAASTKWKHNERGFVTNTIYADGNGPKYTYTSAGRPNTRVWARGITTTYAYNNAGELSTTVYSDGTPGVTNTYDRRGRLTGVVYGTNNASMVYGNAGQLLSETINGVMVTNTYDSFLRRSSVALDGQTSTLVSYGYDAASRLQGVTNGNYTAVYGYHANSILVSNITFAQSGAMRMTTAKSYDNLNRLTRITSAPSSGSVISFDYAYNSANQRTSVTNSDSRWVYGYDSLGQITSGKKYWNDGTPVAGQQFEYAFDDIGNRKYSGSGGDNYGANLRYMHYTANNLNQYTSRTVPNSVSIIGTSTNTSTVTVNEVKASRKSDYYQADVPVDNTTTAVFQGVTNLAIINQTGNSDIVTNIIGSVFVPKTPEAFSYDVDGNLTNDGRWVYTWDPENRLASMTNAPSIPSNARMKLEFAHDYLGRRVSKIVSSWNVSGCVPTSTNRFTYDEANLIAELDHTNWMYRAFVWGLDISASIGEAGGIGGLLQVIVTNSPHIAVIDGNGNVSGLVSALSGTESAKYEYTPFGETVSAQGTAAASNPVRFSTRYQDAESDLLSYTYRHYVGSIGRWLSRDLIGEADSPNLYGFVANSTPSFVDPFGLWTWKGGKRQGTERAIMIPDEGDTTISAARFVGLAAAETEKWLRDETGQPVRPGEKIYRCLDYNVPNTFVIGVAAGKPIDRAVIARWQNKVDAAATARGFYVTPKRYDSGTASHEIESAARDENVWGLALFGHGYKKINGWLDWSPDLDFSDLNGGLAWDKKKSDVITPATIRVHHRLGLVIAFFCYADLQPWKNMAAGRYYGGGTGMINAINGPRAIGYWGSWDGLVGTAADNDDD